MIYSLMELKFKIDQKKVFKVFSGNSGLSPFHPFYCNKKTILRNCGGRLYAHYNGEDINQTYWALRKSAIICDTPERPLEITGPEVILFLDKIFPRQISKLKIDRGMYVTALTHEGNTFMDGILFRLSENCFWFVQPDGDMHTWLLAHKQNYKIEINEPNSRVLQIQGPNSYKILNHLTEGEIDSKFSYFSAGFFKINSQLVYISRTGWTGELGYEIYTFCKKTNYKKLWSDILESGKKYDLKISSMQAMNIRRIEAGILDCGSDFSIYDNPYEVGLGNFVDLKKKFFIGKDKLVNLPKHKLLFGIISNAIIPKGGFVMYDAKKKPVGLVTTGTYSPQFKSGIGYVKFSKKIEWEGKKFFVKNEENNFYECEVKDLPFFDTNKNLPREILT